MTLRKKNNDYLHRRSILPGLYLVLDVINIPWLLMRVMRLLSFRLILLVNGINITTSKVEKSRILKLGAAVKVRVEDISSCPTHLCGTGNSEWEGQQPPGKTLHNIKPPLFLLMLSQIYYNSKLLIKCLLSFAILRYYVKIMWSIILFFSILDIFDPTDVWRSNCFYS